MTDAERPRESVACHRRALGVEAEIGELILVLYTRTRRYAIYCAWPSMKQTTVVLGICARANDAALA